MAIDFNAPRIKLPFDFNILQTRFALGFIGSHQLLARAKLPNLESREAPAFNDAYYLPFYFHLGIQHVEPHVVQVGPVLGLVGHCFLKGCYSTKSWRVYSDEPASFVLGNLNSVKSDLDVSMFPMKDLVSVEGASDLALLSEKVDNLTECLEFLWVSLKPGGLLVVDYISDDAVKEGVSEFARVKNRKPIEIKTRYGVSIIER